MNHNHRCMPHNAAHCLQQRSSYPSAPRSARASCSVPLCPSAPSNAPQCPAVPHGAPTAETAVLLSRRSASQQSAPRCPALYTTVLLSAPQRPAALLALCSIPQRPGAPRSAPERPGAPRSAPQRPQCPTESDSSPHWVLQCPLSKGFAWNTLTSSVSMLRIPVRRFVSSLVRALLGTP